MQYEVFTIGGGRFLYNFFGAVAAICQSSQYQSAVAAAMLISMIWVFFVLAFRPTQWDSLRTWAASSFIIIGLMLTPKATVKVTDRINPVGSSGYIVSNVPVGLAAFAGLTSKIGDETTRLLETNMADVNSPKLRDHGFMFGVRLLSNATRMEVKDADFSTSLSAYIRNCLFYDIMLGRKSLDDLKAAGDPWTYMTGNASVARMFVVQTPVGGGPPVIKTCQAGVADLNAQWNAEIQAATRRLTLFSRPDDIRSNAGAPGRGGNWSEARVNVVMGHVRNDLQSFHRFLIGASRSSADILKRQMTINAIINEPLNWNAELGNAAAVQSYIDARLALQTRQSYRGLARQAEQWVPNLKAVFQGIYYGIFPIAFLMMLSPMGVVILRNYFFGFVWIESWGPLYAIINYFVNSNAQDRMTAVVNAATLGGAGDIQLIAQAGIQAVENDISIQAGYLSMSVPFIAIALAAGAGRFAMLATSTLAVSQEAVADTTRESATGNLSIGNTSHDSHAFHNRSGFTHNTSAVWDSDRSMVYADSGALITETADGRTVIDGRMSQSTTATDINLGQSLSSSYQQQAAESRSAALNASTGLTDTIGTAFSRGSQFADTITSGQTSDFGVTAEERAQMSEDINTVKSAAQSWGRDENVSDKEFINAAIQASAAAKLFGSGLEGRATYEANTSSNISFDEALKFADQEDVRDALNRLSSTSSSETARWSDGENRSYAESLSAAQSQTRDFRTQQETSLQQAERLEALASLVESRSAGINASLNQPFLEWLQTQPSAVGEGNMSFNDAEELLNARDLEGRSRAMLLADQFVREEGHNYVNDPQVRALIEKIDPERSHGNRSSELETKADIEAGYQRNLTSVPSGEHIRDDLRQDGERLKNETGQQMSNAGDEIQTRRDRIEGVVDAGSEHVGNEVQKNPVEQLPKVIQRASDTVETAAGQLEGWFRETSTAAVGDTPTDMNPEDPSGYSSDDFEAARQKLRDLDVGKFEGPHAMPPEDGSDREIPSSDERPAPRHGMPQRGSRDEGWE